MTQDTRTPTLADVEELEEERVERTRALAEAEAEAADARQRARQDPDDGDAIRGQVEAEARVTALKGRLADIAAKITEARQAALHEAVSKRLGADAKRAVGSLFAQVRDAERDAERLDREREEARERKREAARRLHAKLYEVHLLALRFDRDIPDLPGKVPADVVQLREGPVSVEPREDGTVRVRALSGRRTIAGETGQLLHAAGPWERTLAMVNADLQVHRRAEAARQQATWDEVDGWLRDLLKDGPTVRDRVIAAARAAGIPVHPTNNTRGVSLMDARGRLGVLPLEHTADGSRTPFWALRGTDYDEKAFELYRGESDRSRSITANMR